MKKSVKKISISIILLIISIIAILVNINKEEVQTIRVGKNEALIEESLTYRQLDEGLTDLENTILNYLDNRNIEILKYFSDKESVIVTTEIEGYKVEKVLSDAFVDCKNLEVIKIPREIAKDIKEIEKFEISEDLSDEQYVVYITTREYDEFFLRYIKLTDEEKAEIELKPNKFRVTFEEAYPEKVNSKKLYSSNIISDVTIPKSYDLRDHITIPAKDQEEFGICYAYTAMRAAETNVALNYGENVDFSEMQYACMTTGYGGYFNTEYFFQALGPVKEKNSTILSQSYVKSQKNSTTIKPIYDYLTRKNAYRKSNK